MEFQTEATDADALPLLGAIDSDRAVVFDGQHRTRVSAFLGKVLAAARALPEADAVVNLCENRERFLVGLCAALVRQQSTLLPTSRAPAVVSAVLSRYPDSYCLVDDETAAVGGSGHLVADAPQPASETEVPMLSARATAAIGFTSGSTGQPKANRKTWQGFSASTARNVALLLELLAPAKRADIVATVPSQHMYGMETSVLLPLLGPFAVHSARPFFPADVAQALGEAQAPRILVTTPIHLRALLDADQDLPELAAILLATAPLSTELAQAAEARFATTVQELFGSTETCVIAHRRTARETEWQAYPDVELQPLPDGTRVRSPWLEEPTELQDLIECLPQGRFRLRGRNSDLLEIAGKRASLGELTRRLLALPGVIDAVVFQTDETGAFGVRRVAALAVAPGKTAIELIDGLRDALDPVFLPRPLKCVNALPRNETGKLPRAALLALLNQHG